MSKSNHIDLAILLGGVAFIIFFSNLVPYNMDEFLFYHTIMCHHYKFNSLNTFREGCSNYDLDFINTGLVLPLRDYYYVGSITSIMYYPLFLIWKSPLSARFLGGIFLIVQAWLLSKLFKIRFAYIFLGLISFFPYFFQHIVDTGPVRFQTTSIFIAYYLIKRYLKDFNPLFLISVSIIIFLGIWTKLTFFWLLPGIGIIFLISFIENRATLNFTNARKLFLHLLISFSLLLFLTSLLFLSSTPQISSTHPYLDQLLHSSGQYTWKELFNIKTVQTLTFGNLLNPFEATQRAYSVHKPDLFVYFYDSFIYFLLPLACFSLIILSKGKNKSLRKSIFKSMIFYFSFLITIILILRTKRTWAMHHIILAFPFLILSCLSFIGDFLNNKNKLLRHKKFIVVFWFVLFVLSNSYFFITFHNQDIVSHDDYSKNKLNTILNNEHLSRSYFYVVVDWGMYYYQALYGNNLQSVLYMEPFNDPAQVDQLKNMSRSHNRKLLFIYNSATPASDIELIKRSFSVKRCGLMADKAIWQFLLEVDPNDENICFYNNSPDDSKLLG